MGRPRHSRAPDESDSGSLGRSALTRYPRPKPLDIEGPEPDWRARWLPRQACTDAFEVTLREWRFFHGETFHDDFGQRRRRLAPEVDGVIALARHKLYG